MFWSGEMLMIRLKTLISPYDINRIDCAAYTLSVGPEVYVSPSSQTVDSKTVTVQKLNPGQAFIIPPGQFAFLLTEEIVTVPDDALAFISIRATTKFRGLVNVSGFHVDPGYCGQLTFAVFNAGPTTIHLRRGKQIFLIWYASLDRKTQFKKNGKVSEGIDTDLITNVTGELQSFSSLSTKITDVDKALDKRIYGVEKEQAYYRVFVGIALIFLTVQIGAWLKSDIIDPAMAPPQITVSNESQTDNTSPSSP